MTYIPDLTERFPEGFDGVDLTPSFFGEPVDWSREYDHEENETFDETEVVLDRVTGENTSEYCDFVFCNNCGKTMLVNHGENICPECDCKGTLSWVEEDFEKIIYDNAPDLLAGMGYILCDIV